MFFGFLERFVSTSSVKFALAGVVLGCRLFRLACGVYSVIFWLIFLADKSRWNNHTYLYALLSVLLTVSSAHHCLSWSNPRFEGCVPRWNYFIFKFQIFLVYFYAGVKKLDADWVGGYSMRGLATHWLWAYLTSMGVTEWFVEHVIIHLCGLFLDLFAGFLLVWRPTRLLGALLTFVFNALNSRMFAIGMFPYVMIAAIPLFFDYDWPSRLRNVVAGILPAFAATGNHTANSTLLEGTTTSRTSVSRSERRNEFVTASGSAAQTQICSRKTNGSWVANLLVSGFLVGFVSVQVILPFASTHLFPGYDTWTGGLYGHQWNMMVHNWRPGPVRFSVNHSPTGQIMYIDHRKFTRRGNRWFQQADMVWQFARCVRTRLEKEKNLTDIEVKADVWMSLNFRVMQRMFDPRVDVSRAEWSPFSRVPWVIPVQRQFDYLRKLVLQATQSPLDEVVENIPSSNTSKLARATHTDVLLHLPGMPLKNVIPAELELVRVAILNGRVQFVIGNRRRNATQGDIIHIPSGISHSAVTLPPDPAVLVYRYVNASELQDTAASRRPQLAQKLTPRPWPIFSRIARHFGMWYDSFVICYWAVKKLIEDALHLD